jgi:hypothetical protein
MHWFDGMVESEGNSELFALFLVTGPFYALCVFGLALLLLWFILGELGAFLAALIAFIFFIFFEIAVLRKIFS